MALPTASDNVFPKVVLAEGAAPATPSANQVKVYAKADGLVYSKDDAGTETLMSSGAGALTDHNHTAGGDGGDLDAPVIDGYAIFNEESAPSTPSAGTVAVYAKSDGLMYSKDDAGAETALGAGGSGAPTTAKYVTTATDGGLSAEIVIPGLAGSPDIRVGGTDDDEFEALSGWTTLGTLDTSNVTDVPSHWHAKRVNGAVAVDGIYKTAPSMPFTVTAKLSASNVFLGANYNMVGILLTESAPGKLCTIGLVSNAAVIYSSVYRWTNRTTLSTNIDTSTGRGTPLHPHAYIRVLVTSSTSISVSLSDDGRQWWPVTSQQAVTTSLTVANVGLCIGDGAAAGTVEAWFDWVRFT